MSQTFSCPHCGAKYPVKAALIGRNVRCTSCKKAFQLQENGVAIKITGRNDQARQKAQDDDTKRQAIKERMRTTHDRVSEHEQKKRDRKIEAEAKRQRLRQAMAATLNESASQALETEASKEETKRHQRKRAEKRKKEENENSVSQLEVVLTNHGQVEQKQRRVWSLGCIGFLICVGLAFVFMRSDGVLRQALIYYAEMPPADKREYPDRVHHYLDKMWYHSVLNEGSNLIIVDLDKADIADEVIRVDCSQAIKFFSKFEKMTRMHNEEHWQAEQSEIDDREALISAGENQLNQLRLNPDLWVQKDAQEIARSAWWANGGALRSDLILRGQLEAMGKEAMLSREVPKRIQEFVNDEMGARILGRLFIASCNVDGERLWQKRMMNGSIPDWIEYCYFSGVGTLLHDKSDDSAYVHNVPYRGILMRANLLSEPDAQGNEWRVFEIERIEE